MMLKIKKSEVKLFGVIFSSILLCLSCVGISFYNVPEKVSAVSWPLEDRTISDIKYLQEMNKSICDNSKIGDANENVIDTRDDNAYSIGKLADGKCWMTQNLRLTRESIQAKDPSNTTGKITSDNTNLDSGYYEIPASTDSAFDTSKSGSYFINQQVRAAKNNDYGTYYSFNVVTLNKVWNKSSGKADYDICPRGWRLPTSGPSGEYEMLYNKGKSNWTMQNGKNGYWLGGSSSTSLGVTFFPAAGLAGAGGPHFANSWGHYWSNTIADAPNAYNLGFLDTDIYPSYKSTRCDGYPVRCITDEKILETDGIFDNSTGSISVKVANTLSIDAVSGMEEEVDSTSIASGTITATIAGNTNYKVLLSAEKTSLTSTNTANDAEIPALSTVQAGTNAWGIRNSDNTTYSAITTQEKEYYHTTAPSTNPDVPGTIHTFTVGISVSPSLPSDTYSTDVTITAAAA